MSESNTTNEVKEKKPRHRKTAMEKYAAFKENQAKAAKSIAIQATKETLEGVEGFTELRDALAVHNRSIAEGAALLDDATFNAKRENLQRKLANLDAKRQIALNDVSRRSLAKDRVTAAFQSIGASLLPRLEKGEVPSVEEVRTMFQTSVSAEDKAVILDTQDPYAAFRRQKADDSVENTDAETDSDSTDSE